MTSVIWEIFTNVLLPLLVMFGTGWVLDKWRGIDLRALVTLTVNLFIPSFIFYELVSAKLDGALAVRIALFTLCVAVVMFLVAGFIGQCLGYSRERMRSLQIASIFYNSANYGIPTMRLAFGGVAETLQIFVILVQNIGNFTLGVFLFSSNHHPGWKALQHTFRQPSVWAVGCALIIRSFDLPIQSVAWIWVPVDYFHRGLVGIALITLGVQLSQTRVKIPFRVLVWPVCLRLIGGPLIGLPLVYLFGFTGETRDIVLLSTSFPTAVNTALLAHEFQGDSDYAAATVFYSTLWSMLSVTLLIALLRM